MLARCLLKATCIVLATLPYWGHGLIDAGPALSHVRGTPGLYPRSRLSELLVLASRLKRLHTRHKAILGISLASDDGYSRVARRDELTGKESGFLWKLTRSFDDSLKSPSTFNRKEKALRRHKRLTAMENMEKNYEGFHDKLTQFLQTLVTKLRPDSPPGLKYLTLTLDILRPGDLEFITDKNAVVEKSSLVTRITRLLLQTIGPFLKDGNETWLKENGGYMRAYISILDMSAVALNLEPEEDISILSAGIGGLNPVTRQSYHPVNFKDLQAAVNILLDEMIKQKSS